MINTSSGFQTLLSGSSRHFLARILHRGVALDCDIKDMRIYKGACGDDTLTVGSVYSSYAELTINGLSTLLENEDIEIQIGMEVSGSPEYITLGKFTVSYIKSSVYESYITAVGALSSPKVMVDLPPLASPTIANIIAGISSATGLTITLSGLTAAGTITEPLTTMSCRQALGLVTFLLGGYATETPDGNIRISKYQIPSSKLAVDGDRMLSFPTFADNVFTMTGVKVVVSEESTDEEGVPIPEVSYETSTTVRQVYENKYMTAAMFQTFAANIVGYTYMPGEVDLSLGDPRLEPWDCLAVTDLNGDIYNVPCLQIVHTFDGGLSTEVKAAGPAESDTGVEGSITKQLGQVNAEIIKAQGAASTARADAIRANTAANAAETHAQQAITDAGRAQSAADAAQALVDDLEDDVTALNTRVTTAEGNITSVEDDVTALGSRVTTAEGNITSIEGNVTTLGSRVTAAEGDITSIEGDLATVSGQISTINTQVDSVEADVSGLTTRVGTAEGKVSTLEGTVGTLDTNVSRLATRVTAAESSITSVENDVSDLDSRVDTAEGSITTIEGNITTINGRVASAESSITSIGTHITGIENDVSGLATRVSAAEGSISTIEDDIDDIEGDVSGLTTRVGTAEGKVTTLEGQVSTAQTNISNLQGRVSTAESGLSTVESNVSSLQGRVSTTESNITSLDGRLDTAEDDISSIEGNITTIGGQITTITGNVSSLTGRVSTAEGKVTTLEGQVSTAQTNITNLQGRVSTAENGLTTVEGNITSLQDRVEDAEESIDGTFRELAVAQDVVGTINWITSHGTMTNQAGRTFDSNQVYFVVDANGDYLVGNTRYSVVAEPVAADIARYYLLSISDSVQNYVATHLVVDREGLWIIPDSGGNKVLIATGASGNAFPAGTHIISTANGQSTSVAKFSSDGARIGKSGEAHVELDYHSFQLIDVEGSAFMHVSDLRDAEGYYTETRIADGEATRYDLQYTRLSNTLTVSLDGVPTSAYTMHYGYDVNFTTAPASGTIITFKYKPDPNYSNPDSLKAYTLGLRNTASGSDAIGPMSFVEGYRNEASGMYSHAEGDRTHASGWASHAEGEFTIASGPESHAEGWQTEAIGNGSHAEGYGYLTGPKAIGNGSHAEGYDYVTADGEGAHAEGWGSTANGNGAHAEGFRTEANGYGAHAEGSRAEANGQGAHAEGQSTTATGWGAHAEGWGSTADGYGAHAEGYYTEANASYSHAGGYYTTTGGECQTVIGRFNESWGSYWRDYESEDNWAFVIGNGVQNARSNAVMVDWSGNMKTAGDVEDGSGNVLSDKADASDLATVATSGNYNDLSNRPTLAAVATSGNYNDLINRPSGFVTGVKGNSESSYRTGNVNITVDQVGGIAKNTAGNTQQLVRPAHLNGLNDNTLDSKINTLRANRLAFLPADQIIIEKTTDGGVTWVDAGVADSTKVGLFSETRAGVSIPLLNGVKSIKCGLRITITAMKYNVPSGTAETAKYNYWNSNYVVSTERYNQLKEMYFWVSTNSDTASVKVERATGANPNNWSVAFQDDSWGMTGWSGNDYIRFPQGVFGGETTQTTNYWNYRLTIMTRGVNGTTTMATTYTTSAQSINEIRGYGDTWWTAGNEYAANDKLYTHDYQKNVTFPAKVTATNGFTGNVTGNVSGTAANVTGTVAVANGGTGKTNAKDAANAFMNALDTGSSTPVDGDYYISQYVGGGTTTTTYHRRPVSALWSYIQDKISSVLGLTSLQYGGNAATATNATKVNNHTVAVDVPTGAKFTDTVTTATTSGSGNAVTAITASNGALTVTKGATFLTSHQDISGKADKSATVSTVAWDSTNKRLTKTINGAVTEVVSAATLRTGLNVADGAEVNQNAFSNVQVGSTTVSADTKTDTLVLAAGSNISLTPDTANDKVTIAATGIPSNTSDLSNDSGFMSKLDVLDMFYPIGSYYETSDSTFNPNTAWGGTWSLETAGQVHVSAGTGYAVGATGGGTTKSYTPAGTIGGHTLTDAQMAHGHGFTQPTVNGGATTTGGMSTNSSHSHGTGNTDYPRWVTAQDTSVSSASGTLASGSYKFPRQPSANGFSTRSVTESVSLAHTHSQVAHTHSVSGGAVSNLSGASSTRTAHDHSWTGTAANINVMQPYIVVNRWHRTA